MFDHIGFLVRDSAVSLPFFTACLKPLGIERVQDRPEFDAAIFGIPRQRGFLFVAGGGKGVPSFWRANHSPGGAPMHLAFTAPDRAAVDAFHAAALAAGGRDKWRAWLPSSGPPPGRQLRRLRPRSRQQQHRGVLDQSGIGRTLPPIPQKR